jgi:nitrite reductase (NO-forming)
VSVSGLVLEPVRRTVVAWGSWPGWASGPAQVGRLIPAVVAGFALQTLTGALTYLLPVVFGRGAHGNRRLTRILELGWPLRVGAVNLGVLLLVAGPAGGWAPGTGWWLAGLGLASFVPLAVVALVSATHRPR